MTALVASLKQYRMEGTKWVFIFSKTPKRKGQCKVIYCARPGRVEVKRSKWGFRPVIHSICPTCQSRLYRANNPAKEAYRQIKDRALRRKQIFDLSFAEFLEVIEGTEYLTRRGREIDGLHLDRIKVHLGYVKGNLQVITTEENLRKQREVDYANEPF